MRHVMSFTVLVCGLLAFVASGCSHGAITIGASDPHVGHHDHGYGPPPHAPANGYRWKRHHHDHDVDLVFNSDLGVYVVVDIPNRFYWNGYYLRIEDDGWYASVDLDGRWKPRAEDSLPPGLRKKYAKHGKGKHGKGNVPAKGNW